MLAQLIESQSQVSDCSPFEPQREFYVSLPQTKGVGSGSRSRFDFPQANLLFNQRYRVIELSLPERPIWLELKSTRIAERPNSLDSPLGSPKELDSFASKQKGLKNQDTKSTCQEQ